MIGKENIQDTIKNTAENFHKEITPIKDSNLVANASMNKMLAVKAGEHKILKEQIVFQTADQIANDQHKAIESTSGASQLLPHVLSEEIFRETPMTFSMPMDSALPVNLAAASDVDLNVLGKRFGILS